MNLTDIEKATLNGDVGTAGDQMALQIVVEAGRMLGARDLVPVTSAHIDGCLYHGTSGTLFCERLVTNGAKVKVPATTNVGALNLLNPEQSRLQGDARRMAFRLMIAHEQMGCRPSWTCAPYQAGARPALGDQVAWGESNAVAFVNSVLGARTNRYGDFLDIACAIAGRAPRYGLHVDENRHAELVLDVSSIPTNVQSGDVFYPVLGALIGSLAGSQVCAVTGLVRPVPEDDLKALCAGAAATGAVGLVHLVGITPEAPDLQSALGQKTAREVITVTSRMLAVAQNKLSRSQNDQLDCVALGSPHFSESECRSLLNRAQDKRFRVPVYICTGRHVLAVLEQDGSLEALKHLGVQFVVDTCVVVTPILPETPGVMMTNSAKFAHYSQGNTGYLPVFGSLSDCVESAQAGRVIRKQVGGMP